MQSERGFGPRQFSHDKSLKEYEKNPRIVTEITYKKRTGGKSAMKERR